MSICFDSVLIFTTADTTTGPAQELALGRLSLCELKLGEVTRQMVELNDGTGRAELDVELLYELVST